jgi:hypothetical protein
MTSTEREKEREKGINQEMKQKKIVNKMREEREGENCVLMSCCTNKRDKMNDVSRAKNR